MLGFTWGVLFPWGAALPLLYMPDVLAQVVNFTSLVFVSFTDFIVPFALYFILQRQGGKLLPASRALAMSSLEEGLTAAAGMPPTWPPLLGTPTTRSMQHAAMSGATMTA